MCGGSIPNLIKVLIAEEGHLGHLMDWNENMINGTKIYNFYLEFFPGVTHNLL